MEFKRRKAKGRSRETYKLWVSDCGFFRINWTNEWGYKHYHACVKVEAPNGFRWEFALRRGPHKTFKKAVESCEKNKRLWDAFIKLSHAPGRRDGKLLQLKVRAPSVFFSVPLFVREQADPALIDMLLCPSKDRNDSTEASEITSSNDTAGPSLSPSDSTPTSGPVSPAPAEAGIATPPTEMSSKATSSRRTTRAKPAMVTDEEPKKRSRRSTTKSSPSSEPISPPGKTKKLSAKTASPSSRKPKRKP
jgi:hypothetical protein